MKQRFADLGVETVQSSPEDTAKFITELMALVDSYESRSLERPR